MKVEYTEGGPIPESVGLTADLYSETRELRLSMQKIVDAVKSRENELKESIINRLSKSDDTGAAGKKYRAQIVSKVVPALKDWEALTAYIAANNRFDLVYKRVSDKPVKDMWDAGEEVPGVERFNAVDVSITKI